jgi:hypothetical protein
MSPRLPLVPSILWLVIWLMSIGIAFVFGLITGTFDKTIQELPVAFWLVVLGIILLGCLPFILARGRPSPPQPVPGSVKLSIITHSSVALLFMLLAFLNNLITPNHGATTVIFAIVAIENLVLAMLHYRRLRLRPESQLGS